MNEILKVMLIRVGLTYGGVSLGLYGLSEMMIASGATSIRNPAWRLVYLLRHWVLLSWQALGIGLLVVLALGLFGLIIFIVTDLQEEHTLQHAKKREALEAEAFRTKQEEISKARALENANLDQLRQKKEAEKKKRKAYDLFSAKQSLTEHEHVSIEEMAQRSLDDFKRS